MNGKNIFWAAFIILVIIFIAGNISMRMEEKKNAPAEQYIETIRATVTAPPFKRQEKLETAAKEKLKEKVRSLYFYSSSYRNVDYILYYCEYLSEIDLKTGIDSVIEQLKEDNFVYEVEENELNSYKGMYLEGTFERKGKKFGIKEQLVKDKSKFWQILTVYPYTKKNNTAAAQYIQSAAVNLKPVKEKQN